MECLHAEIFFFKNIFVCFIKSKQNKCQTVQGREAFQTVMQNLIQILHSMRILISLKKFDLRYVEYRYI